jgi:2-polyprenyl-3-methyl-5-hydroxy-6-metoxy-1,4-benzoquinol methylase
VLRFFADRTPGICLDLGYCRGSFADYLAQLGWDCIGLDIVRRRIEQNGVKNVQGDVFRGLPLADASIDTITAGEIIEHLTDECAFLQECRRVLRKDGCLVLTTPNLSFSFNRGLVLLGKMPMFVYAPYHYRIYTVASLAKAVQASGFVVKKVTSSHTLYSTRRHPTGKIFEWLGDRLPTLGAHIILLAEKS